MHALALIARETIAVHNMDAPELQADELLIQNLACGVCGGDIKNFKGERSQELSAHGRSYSDCRVTLTACRQRQH